MLQPQSVCLGEFLFKNGQTEKHDPLCMCNTHTVDFFQDFAPDKYHISLVIIFIIIIIIFIIIIIISIIIIINGDGVTYLTYTMKNHVQFTVH